VTVIVLPLVCLFAAADALLRDEAVVLAVVLAVVFFRKGR